MHLKDELLLLRHGRQIAVEAVDHDHSTAALLDFPAHQGGKLTRRHFSRVDLLDHQATAVDVLLNVEPERLGSYRHRPDPLVELVDRRAFATLAGSVNILERDRRLTG